MKALARLAIVAAGLHFLGSGELSLAALPAVPPSRADELCVAAHRAAEASAWHDLHSAYPAVQVYREHGRVSRLCGTTFGAGVSPEAVATQFLDSHAEALGSTRADLAPANGRAAAALHGLPLMYDRARGTYRFTLLCFEQVRDGVPVFRSDIRLLVRNEPGFPLVWVGSSLKQLGDFRPPPARHATMDPARIAPGMTACSAPTPVIWAGQPDAPEPPRQAWVFTAGNNSVTPPDDWLFVADARTGEILYRESLVVSDAVTGTVHAVATSGPGAPDCSSASALPMAHARVTAGAATTYTNPDGSFAFSDGGAFPITVQSDVDGLYFDVFDRGGGSTGTVPTETLSQSIATPTPVSFLHNALNTDPFIRAQVNAYVHANRAHDWVLRYNPQFPAIATELDFPLFVNHSCSCNAWYHLVEHSISTCAGLATGDACANMAFSDVIYHEYGHHIVQMSGSGQGAYGEGYGDVQAVLIGDDPNLARGYRWDCSASMRSADNNFQYPCSHSSSVHYCAPLFSGCIWSTRNALKATHPDDYLEILSALALNSVPLHGPSTAITPAIYLDFVTLDGGVTGPHFAEITAGFAAHSMVPGPPPDNDVCGRAILACPGSTHFGNTVWAIPDGADSCGGATSTDVWYKYRPGTSGTATFSLCGAGTEYGAQLSLHFGCPGTPANTVACSATGCGELGAVIDTAVSAGTLYLIRVAGDPNAIRQAGPYELVITGPDCMPGDSTPPTPNPMSFATPPTAVSTSALTMTAAIATDSESPPVQYLFEFVSGGAGATSSGWQGSTTFVPAGLAPNTAYSYRVRARDNASYPNETGPSDIATAVTLIPTPGIYFSTITSSTIALFATGALGNLSLGSSGVYFESTTPGGNGGLGNWIQSTNALATGLMPNTSYAFRCKARNQAGIETPFGSSGTRVTRIETPLGVAPGIITTDSIELIATGTLTNLTSGNSGVYFNATTSGGNAGIAAWVQTGRDTATGLGPNSSYVFRVKARNQSGVETDYSSGTSFTTAAIVPVPPVLSDPTCSTTTISIGADGNPAITEYAVLCTASTPADQQWVGKYVTDTGNPAATPTWQTRVQWGSQPVAGLRPGTSYRFAVIARNGAFVETAPGPEAELATQQVLGDLNGDCMLSADDLLPFAQCLSGPEVPIPPSGCDANAFAPSDTDGDGDVDIADYATFELLTSQG